MAGKDVEIVIGAKDLATRVLDGVAASTSRLQSSVLKASVIMTGAFAAFQTLKGVSGMFLEQVDAVDKLVTQSIKLGTTVNELEGFRFALESIANIEPGSADAMLTKLARAIGDAALKGEEADGAFKTLGLDLKSLANSSTTKAFETVVEALRKVENKTEQLSLTTKLFGRSGADLLPVIRDTSEAYDDAAGAAERLGLALTDIEIAQIQAADTALEEMQRTITGIVRKITVELTPAITAMAEGFAATNQSTNVFTEYLKNAVGSLGLIAVLINDISTDPTKLWGEAGTGLDKYLDKLKFAQMEADAGGLLPGGKPEANVASVAAAEHAMEAADKIAKAQEKADEDRLDKFKKLQEEVMRDVEREKESSRQKDLDSANAIKDAVDPTRVADRQRDEIKRLLRLGMIDAADARKATLDLLPRESKDRSVQAFEGRLLRFGDPNKGLDPIAKNTKETNHILKELAKTLANRDKSQALNVTLVN